MRGEGCRRVEKKMTMTSVEVRQEDDERSRQHTEMTSRQLKMSHTVRTNNMRTYQWVCRNTTKKEHTHTHTHTSPPITTHTHAPNVGYDWVCARPSPNLSPLSQSLASPNFPRQQRRPFTNHLYLFAPHPLRIRSAHAPLVRRAATHLTRFARLSPVG